MRTQVPLSKEMKEYAKILSIHRDIHICTRTVHIQYVCTYMSICVDVHICNCTVHICTNKTIDNRMFCVSYVLPVYNRNDFKSRLEI